MTHPYQPASSSIPRQYRNQATMLRIVGAAVMAGLLGVAMLATDPARAAQPLMRFEGGIGSQPLASGGITPATDTLPAVQRVATNNVFDVNPGGRPWVIERLSATIDINSNIKVVGKGLLLAGGNAVARNGGASVRPLLLCTAGATVTSRHTTPAKLLAPNGDFSFDEPLTPQVPPDCGTPVLLIVNAAGAWFAAGIPKD